MAASSAEATEPAVAERRRRAAFDFNLETRSEGDARVVAIGGRIGEPDCGRLVAALGDPGDGYRRR